VARRITLNQHLEDAELRVQWAQQREALAALEGADRDTAKAKRYLRILEKAWPFTSPIGTGWPNSWQTVVDHILGVAPGDYGSNAYSTPRSRREPEVCYFAL
jgi:hypothetical protein